MGKPTRGQPHATPELKKETAAILDLLRKGEDEHWQMGAHYNKIVSEHLAEKSGYKGPREYFAAHAGAIPGSTLRLYGAIARAFSEEVSKKYGVTLLQALLTY